MDSGLIVRGRAVDAPADQPDAFAELYDGEDGLRYRPRGAVQVAGVARGDSTSIELSGDASDVVEITDVDGLVSFHTAGELARRRGDDRGADTAVVDRTATRAGLGRVAVVRRFELQLPAEIVADLDLVGRIADAVIDPAARAAMRRVVEWIDRPVADDAPRDVRRRRPKQPGLYRLDRRLLAEPARRVAGADVDGDGPALVLLHGTFSHTEAAFTGLRDTTEWERLVSRYGDRLLAFEHPTLSRTPAENALALAEALPAGTHLHLLSHSRGGLIGDVLSSAARSSPDLRFYRARFADHTDVDVLPTLREELKAKAVTVERFVRIACPARGTTLASRRVDRYAAFLFNVFNLLPVVRESGVAQFVKKFLLTLLDKRADPKLVPGIEAMMPESPFIQMLNTAPRVDDGLAAIAGDIEATGVLRRLLVAAADLFYREDHDLVVNTGAMAGGVPRPRSGWSFHKGGEVNHSAYLVNDRSRRAIDAWLDADGTDVPGFEEDGRDARAASRRSRGGSSETAAGRVIVVPDLMGTTLVRADVEHWPGTRQLSESGLRAVLAAGAAPFPGDLVWAYEPLRRRLADGYAVDVFPYDWRASLRASGEDLARMLVKRRDEADGAVHLVGHGAGALVVLAALAHDGATWAELRRRGSRAVLLGPPLHGTWSAVARLLGRDHLTHALALVDPTADRDQIADMFGTWTSLVELLPEPLDPDRWRPLDGAYPGTRAIQHAAAFRHQLAQAPSDGVTVICGHAPRTIDGDGQVGLAYSAAGDGFTCYGPSTALPTFYARTPHASLPSTPLVCDAVAQVLAGRPPDRLLATPPVVTTPPTPFTEPAGRIPFPSDDELVSLAMGGGVTAAGTAPPPLRVSVVHGDVTAVDTPVLIGTTDGTPLAGAEKDLDDKLGGALARRLTLGGYPGPPNTSEVVARGDRGLWAVVIGLGNAGDITPGQLTESVMQAVLATAARRRELLAQPEPFTLSSVLVGTTGAGALSIATSISAIVHGVVRANERLREVEDEAPVYVDALQLVELFEDRADQAARAVQAVAAELKENEVAVEKLLRDGCGGRSGQPPLDHVTQHWRTIRVTSRRPATSADDHLMALSFTSVGRSARAEQQVTAAQHKLLDRLIAQSIHNPYADTQLYNTLYELLVPPSMKGQGKETENLMYVVDAEASKLPLEMLATRGHDTDAVAPLAVDVGVVRRLETDTFRESVRSSTGNRALVIADPPTETYQRLPGAIIEARRVEALLSEHGYDVTALIPRDVDDTTSVDVAAILNALFARDYRIVHVAAHGTVASEGDNRVASSGILIGEDTLLTAAEVHQMRSTPDLVFLNACHVGSMEPRRPISGAEPPWRPDRLAASISRQLIDNGVRAVVAAGWAVNDRAAADFAEVFYGRLLSGDDLGGASHAARRGIYRRYADDGINTWGAYHVYGPPAFRLSLQSPGNGGDRDPVSRKELNALLRELTTRSEDATGHEVDSCRQRLIELRAHVPERWLGGAELARIGGIWFNLGEYGQAVDAYERSIAEWGSDAPLRAMEHLVNAQVKIAADPTADLDAAQRKELRAQARTLLDQLLGICESPERYSLLGSFWRRQAGVAVDDELAAAGDQTGAAADESADDRTAIASRADALVKARDAYRRAWDLQLSTRSTPDPYSGTHWAVLAWLTGDGADGVHEVLNACRAHAATIECPGFYENAHEADALLAQGLVDGDLTANVQRVVAAYRGAFERGSSTRHRQAIHEHVELLRKILPPRSDAADDAYADARAALAVLCPQIESLVRRSPSGRAGA